MNPPQDQVIHHTKAFPYTIGQETDFETRTPPHYVQNGSMGVLRRRFHHQVVAVGEGGVVEQQQCGSPGLQFHLPSTLLRFHSRKYRVVSVWRMGNATVGLRAWVSWVAARA
ncbi:hypothetical protein DMENIID0001_150890 [Sergentomyia squamirostris]